MSAAPHVPRFAQPPGDSSPRRALILAGGGMRVAYQAGVLRALDEHGLTFSHADGTSGGTINLAMIFSGLSAVEMCDRWRALDPKHFASPLPLEQYVKMADMPAMGDADGIVQHVIPDLGIDFDAINAATGMVGTFNVCNYSRKTSEVIEHTAIDRDLFVAGISLPIFMPPVRHGTDLYIDAVWIRDANLMEAVRRGAEELWVVWCIGNIAEYKNGAFNQYVHMIEIAANGALFGEFERITEINARIAAGETVYGHTRPIRLHLIKPEHPLPLDPEYFLGHIDGAALIAMGYADAVRYLRTSSPEGIPLAPEATHMTTPTTGVTFRETMSGGFALGETDPHAGDAKGKSEGSILAMHATIGITDVDTFIADPNHLGGITGTIDFPAFGMDIPATTGVFNLFSPTDQPRLKLMVYEMGFTHGGKDYYLAGKKEVRSDFGGLDLWKDTTTLLTQLHDGRDRSGAVIGAGVLTLGPFDLMKMVSTMRATNAPTPADSGKALMRFGEFFMGQLWKTYFTKG